MCGRQIQRRNPQLLLKYQLQISIGMIGQHLTSKLKICLFYKCRRHLIDETVCDTNYWFVLFSAFVPLRHPPSDKNSTEWKKITDLIEDLGTYSELRLPFLSIFTSISMTFIPGMFTAFVMETNE